MSLMSLMSTSFRMFPFPDWDLQLQCTHGSLLLGTKIYQSVAQSIGMGQLRSTKDSNKLCIYIYDYIRISFTYTYIHMYIYIYIYLS